MRSFLVSTFPTASVSVTIVEGTLLPLKGSCQGEFPVSGKGPRNKKKRRGGVLVSWNDAVAIAGSETKLELLRDKKTVQNWKSGDHDEPRIPASALAPFLVDWWRGKHAEVIELRVAEAIKPYAKKLRAIHDSSGG